MPHKILQVDVAIVGAGPAGLAAATALRHRGVDQVVVLDREAQGGGIPRHCGHPPFGMLEFHRILTGPQYAQRLVTQAINAGVNLLTRHSVTRLLPGGELAVATPDGLVKILARRVLIATGVRETPRSARLVTGARPQGITTTGALQSMVYLQGLVPFKRPVVIGTELVAFSALMTAASAGIKPVAMLESGARITARYPCQLLPLFKGIPLLLNTELTEILGINTVQGVSVKDTKSGQSRVIDCDGVIFTGQFTAEATLARMSHLELDPASGGLQIDQFGRCSDPVYFAAGNILRPVETAGWSYREGTSVAAWIADDLARVADATNDSQVILNCEDPIKLVVPQRIIAGQAGGFKYLQLRVSRPVTGELLITAENNQLWSKKMSLLPERRILIPIAALNYPKGTQTLRVYFKEQ